MKTITCTKIKKNLSKWTSPNSKETYGEGWHISASKKQIGLTVEPRLENQEVLKGFWEGNCKVYGTFIGTEVEGNAFVELQNGLKINFFKKLVGYTSARFAHW